MIEFLFRLAINIPFMVILMVGIVFATAVALWRATRATGARRKQWGIISTDRVKRG